MDALSRADEALHRAQARRAHIVTPDSATSPMDQSATVQIPRTMVLAADGDPDTTMVIPGLRPDVDPPRPRGDFGPVKRR